MSKEQKLASVGLGNTPEDIAKFYEMFPTAADYDAYMSGNQQYAMGGNLRSFQPGGTAKKRLYDVAMDYYNNLKNGDPRLWKEDPDMLNPDGSLNLCVDCINVDYDDPQDVQDVNTLIEQGYSQGTHYNHDKYEEALKKFGLPKPQYAAKKTTGMKFGGLTDGIAFPQQPDASSRRVPYYDKGGFFAPNVMPWNGPVGFYQKGGQESGRYYQEGSFGENTPMINYRTKGMVYNIPVLEQMGQDLQGKMNMQGDANIQAGVPVGTDGSTIHPSLKPKRSAFNKGVRKIKRNINNFLKYKVGLDNIGFSPKKNCGPDGCPEWFEDGGMTSEIAFPQQPTEHINFSAFPWQPSYAMGGGLPGGANEGVPCMECGGYMEDGGATQYGGLVDGEIDYFKEGGNWIQKATASIKKRGTEGVCTGSKFGGPSCPPGSKRYNLAKTFRSMAKNKKAYGGVTGSGMEDTDTYTNDLKEAFLGRIMPEQQADPMMQSIDPIMAEETPMAYNGYTMPGGYNFGFNNYNFQPNLNTRNELNEQSMQNEKDLMRRNKIRSAENLALQYGITNFLPVLDPNRKFTQHTFKEFAKKGGALRQFQGTGPSQTGWEDFYRQQAQQEALDIWNRYKNQGAKSATKYNADPNDAEYNAILQRTMRKYHFDDDNTQQEQSPKWDPNDPSKYLDYYFNKRRSANNQTQYDYNNWDSWNNVKSNNGTYTYNTPGGSNVGLVAPGLKYLDEALGGKGDLWGKEYFVNPAASVTSFNNRKGLFGLRGRDKGTTVRFDVYRRGPGQTIPPTPPNKEDNTTKSNLGYQRPSRNMISENAKVDYDMSQDGFKMGGLLKAANGMQNPNQIVNMMNALDPMNKEIPVGSIDYTETQKKTPLSGSQKASALVTTIGGANYATGMNQQAKNFYDMPITADEAYNPMQAGLVGSRGNIGAGIAPQVSGVPFGGTGTTYGIQSGYVKKGGQIKVGEVLDLTDEEIQDLIDQGYDIGDVEDYG